MQGCKVTFLLGFLQVGGDLFVLKLGFVKTDLMEGLLDLFLLNVLFEVSHSLQWLVNSRSDCLLGLSLQLLGLG